MSNRMARSIYSAAAEEAITTTPRPSRRSEGADGRFIFYISCRAPAFLRGSSRLGRLK